MVLYVVCYDLSANINDQRRQISTWIRYLNSLLINPKNPTPFISNNNRVPLKVLPPGPDLPQAIPIPQDLPPPPPPHHYHPKNHHEHICLKNV